MHDFHDDSNSTEKITILLLYNDVLVQERRNSSALASFQCGNNFYPELMINTYTQDRQPDRQVMGEINLQEY